MGKSTPLIVFCASFAVLLLLGIVVRWELLPELRTYRKALEGVGERLDRIEEYLALEHFSREPGGRPVEAVLEHLRFWSDREEEYGSSIVEQPILQEKIRLAMTALKKLGAPAYQAVVDEFQQTASDPKQREYRKRLLKVLRELDPRRAKELCSRLLGTSGRDPQIRTEAAQILLDLDPVSAGAKIRHVILNESYRGPRHRLPTGEARDLPPGLKFSGYPGFFNLVNIYLRSRDQEKVEVLLLLLRTDGHDIATLQAAIQGLEEKKAISALPRMKDMFEHPKTVQQSNTYVRRRLAHAVVRIAGTDACPWLKEMFAQESDGAVRRVLSQLLKAHCVH